MAKTHLDGYPLHANLNGQRRSKITGKRVQKFSAR
jgi:hypothetical protein